MSNKLRANKVELSDGANAFLTLLSLLFLTSTCPRRCVKVFKVLDHVEFIFSLRTASWISWLRISGITSAHQISSWADSRGRAGLPRPLLSVGHWTRATLVSAALDKKVPHVRLSQALFKHRELKGLGPGGSLESPGTTPTELEESQKIDSKVTLLKILMEATFCFTSSISTNSHE